ncbi:phosphodiesterase [Seohaeicola saemankumensis]|uniref:glycerophosphodiester phosphodiesterase family protein n=1 Tax=Seohaeicola saemankumensis TaxID=481181 RepID=UPI001E5D4535|nr:glycerophosphodiester phosphodiesterase family protein [Seohaeicola saemankumensis]MCD1624786.1 phosphodiesterase [Seohaeicola saemankumensis]
MSRLPEDFLKAPIAHRALHDLSRGRPENGPSAIEAACKAGYGIEIDLQLSSDGVAMVFHDYDLGRLTDSKGAVRQVSAAALGQIRLKGGTDTIPTLEQVLDQVAGRVPLLIEIKDQDGAMGARVGALEAAAAKVLGGYKGLVAVMSFNPHSMIAMAALAPDIPRGLTTCDYAAEDWPLLPKGTRDRLRAIPDFDAARACFISHDASDLEATRVADLKARGAAILCWTIKSAREEAQARQIAQNVTFEGYAAAIPA